MKPKFKVPILAGAALITLVIPVYMILIKVTDTNDKLQITSDSSTYTDNVQKVSLSYPKQTTVNPLSQKDKIDKFIFRAGYTGGTPYLITLRYEDGLATATQLAKLSMIDLLLGNTTRAFPSRYTDYKQISQTRYDLSGHQAADIVFTYTGPSGEVAQQQLTIIVKDQDKAFYLSQQSKQSDFAALESLFKSVSSSIKIQ